MWHSIEPLQFLYIFQWTINFRNTQNQQVPSFIRRLLSLLLFYRIIKATEINKRRVFASTPGKCVLLIFLVVYMVLCRSKICDVIAINIIKFLLFSIYFIYTFCWIICMLLRYDSLNAVNMWTFTMERNILVFYRRLFVIYWKYMWGLVQLFGLELHKIKSKMLNRKFLFFHYRFKTWRILSANWWRKKFIVVIEYFCNTLFKWWVITVVVILIIEAFRKADT